MCVCVCVQVAGCVGSALCVYVCLRETERD